METVLPSSGNENNDSRTSDEIINEEFVKLDSEILLIDGYRSELKNKLNSFASQYCFSETDNISQRPNNLQQRYSRENDLKLHFYFVVDTMNKLCSDVEDKFRKVLDYELVSWKRSQQSASIQGFPDSNRLNIIQHWCEKLCDIIWRFMSQIKETENLSSSFNNIISNHLLVIYRRLVDLLRRLICETFIVEQQPPQVIKLKTNLTVKLVSLIGGYFKNQMNRQTFTNKIVNEAQAKALLAGKPLRTDKCGEMSVKSGVLTWDENSRKLSSEIKMQLTSIQRAEKRGSESVVEEKFFLHFHFDFGLNDEFNFKVQTLSLPVTVIVHINQELAARATILWYNAFSEPSKELFTEPDSVEWYRLMKILNNHFYYNTKKQLSEEQTDYLAERLFGIAENGYSSRKISKQQFCKTALRGTNFSFWEWFCNIIKLIKEHLKDAWEKDYIIGFIRKSETESLLSNCPPGTFLLRFSESRLGSIAIAYVSEDDRNSVDMCMLTTKDHFNKLPLEDHIGHFDELKFLYPNIPKSKAFHSNQKNVSNTPVGYKHVQLKPKITGSDSTENQQTKECIPCNYNSGVCSDTSSISSSTNQSRESSRATTPNKLVLLQTPQSGVNDNSTVSDANCGIIWHQTLENNSQSTNQSTFISLSPSQFHENTTCEPTLLQPFSNSNRNSPIQFSHNNFTLPNQTLQNDGYSANSFSEINDIWLTQFSENTSLSNQQPSTHVTMEYEPSLNF